MPNLFDMELRMARRDRAARLGPELFLHERAFEDCLDRLSLVQRRFERAILIGCPDQGWTARLQAFANIVDVRDPGPLFAQAAGGELVVEDAWDPVPGTYDLALTIGTLDTVNDLPRALIALRLAMQAGGLFLGALSGGDTLPQLRAAMRDADGVIGAASPHVHPRIEASAMAPLLARCGFLNPVVDVDRVQVSYASFARLVGDLRRMGATNLLAQRSKRPLSRPAFAAASAAFDRAGDGDRTMETLEILHFACWNPSAP